MANIAFGFWSALMSGKMSGKMSLDEKDVLGEFEKAKVFSCLNANIRKVLSFLRSAYGPKCLCSPGCAVIESL